MRMLAVLWFVVSFPRELGGAGSPLVAVMAAVVQTERSQTSLEVLQHTKRAKHLQVSDKSTCITSTYTCILNTGIFYFFFFYLNLLKSVIQKYFLQEKFAKTPPCGSLIFYQDTFVLTLLTARKLISLWFLHCLVDVGSLWAGRIWLIRTTVRLLVRSTSGCLWVTSSNGALISCASGQLG